MNDLIKHIVSKMSVEEKIGQKIMLDFNIWKASPDGEAASLTEPNKDIEDIISSYKIGGIILFTKNLENRPQSERLTSWLNSMITSDGVRLLIGTDNEGGYIFRLPRGEYRSFSGNMSLASAVAATNDSTLAFKQGQQMGEDLRSLHINTDFAPVVDVNTNPCNPVIHIRSFSDDPSVVNNLAQNILKGLASTNTITAYKHFPGHGNASTDSHTSLPRVDRDRKSAYSIDLAPYQSAISSGTVPEMVLTAHIQYPSLDNSEVSNKAGVKIIVPATMSRKILNDILRIELGFTGVVITDALDMAAISANFEIEDAIEYVFNAGVDIALMPVALTSVADKEKLGALITKTANKVRAGQISETEITNSVMRILALKEKHGLLSKDDTQTPPIKIDRTLEKTISDAGITLIKNLNHTLPIANNTKNFFILTQWGEQGNAIKQTMQDNGFSKVTSKKFKDTPSDEKKKLIENCDVFITGSASSIFSPTTCPDGSSTIAIVSELRELMQYAQLINKIIIHVSMLSPYDIINFDDLAHACLATYSPYGLENGVLRGTSMVSLAEILTGKLSPSGKLPVNIYKTYDTTTNTGEIAYPRWYGLQYSETT